MGRSNWWRRDLRSRPRARGFGMWADWRTLRLGGPDYFRAARSRSRSKPAIISLTAIKIGRLIRFGSFAIRAKTWSGVSDLPPRAIALKAGLREFRKSRGSRPANRSFNSAMLSGAFA